MASRTIWALTDGKIGMVNQAFGLASAIAREAGNFDIIEKEVVPSRLWSFFPAGMWPPGISGVAAPRLEMPWPDLVVGCGRHAVGPAIWIKRQSGGSTRIVHAQHPRTGAERFDAIVSQSHDGLSGANVIVVLGSMNRLTGDLLSDAVQCMPVEVTALPEPVLAVLLGGTNSTYRMTTEIASKLADDLQMLVALSGCGLMVTASRRTGVDNEALLRSRLKGPGIYFWDGVGDNPYFTFLARADAILVTCDSVNMVSEACYTGKPVYVLALDGGTGSKFARFHEEMNRLQYTRPFLGDIELTDAKSLDETTRAAREIVERLAL